MSGIKMSSAYSDDGKTRTRLVVTDDGLVNNMQERINRLGSQIEEPDTGVSITAELSDRRGDYRQRPDEDEDVISERPDESENRSGPEGTIGEPHDIMSENIESNFHFRRAYKVPYTQIADQLSDEGVSKEAHKSTATKMSAVAHVSPTIHYQESSRSIQAFGMIYDKLFSQFQEQLAREYGQMRNNYMSEYQVNFNQNSSRRDDKISEMNLAIESKEEKIRDLKK